MLIEIKVPALAESVPDATCLEWNVKIGDEVRIGDNLIDLETDKVTLEITATENGIIKEILKKEGEIVLSGEILATVDTSQKLKATAIESNDKTNLPNTREDQEHDPLAKVGPAVKKMLTEKKIDPSKIIGTGRDKRITKGDVLAYIEKTEDVTGLNQPDSTNNRADASENEMSHREDKRVPMTRLRKRISEKLLEAQEKNALLTTFNEADMSGIQRLRELYKAKFEKNHEVKLGFMSFFIKACIDSLKEFPMVNASIEGDDIIYHNYFDIGVAIGAGKGLVVPVIKDANLLSFGEIEKKIIEYGDKASNSKLTVEELTGGTFTISNGGIYGSMLSTPIINSPQSAILGMHKIQERPVVREQQIVIRPMMYLALTYDHRLIDGREAVQFLDTVRQKLEDPSRLLLEI